MKGGSGPDAAELEPDPHRAGWVPLQVLKLLSPRRAEPGRCPRVARRR